MKNKIMSSVLLGSNQVYLLHHLGLLQGSQQWIWFEANKNKY